MSDQPGSGQPSGQPSGDPSIGYRLIVVPSARREINKLPQDVRPRVAARILSLGRDPRPHGAIKMKGRASYRVRVGDYRVVYNIEDAVRIVTVTKVGHRREVYQ